MGNSDETGGQGMLWPALQLSVGAFQLDRELLTRNRGSLGWGNDRRMKRNLEPLYIW